MGRRQRGGNINGLVDAIREVCRMNSEGETFCVENADLVREYYIHRGVKFQSRDIPEDVTGLSVVVVVMEVVDTTDPRFAVLRHGFSLVRDGSQWYLADSWQGIHPFVARPIDIDAWLAEWRSFVSELKSGRLNRDQLTRLFGDWAKEKEELRKAGEWVNDYPKTQTGSFIMKRMNIQIA
jgi:hypothetical protein